MGRTMRYARAAALLLIFSGFTHAANADFIISSAIVEFNEGGQSQQDIELASRAKTDDYIVSEVSEVLHPGSPDETRHKSESPAELGLLVTPDKTILPAGARKVLRFVLLKNPDASEHIYRVAIKPVIRGMQANAKVGLKVLIGYEVLVIVRPSRIQPAYHAERHGTSFRVSNTGNTNILFQNGRQCADCKLPPVLRVYPGQSAEVTLPLDKPVSYSIWDGRDTILKRFE